MLVVEYLFPQVKVPNICMEARNKAAGSLSKTDMNALSNWKYIPGFRVSLCPVLGCYQWIFQAQWVEMGGLCGWGLPPINGVESTLLNALNKTQYCTLGVLC